MVLCSYSHQLLASLMDKAALDKMVADYKEKLLLDHVAYPDEVAEAYVFLMK